MAVEKISPEEQKKLAELGNRLRIIRKALGYKSYEEFANKKGFNRGLYWRYEKGENMKILNLVKVAKALETSLDELLRDWL
jgi:transcriptional regulator with XRE-family HTH domain